MKLAALSRSKLTLQDPDHNVDGYTVLAKDGEPIGEVCELFVDEDERSVRFIAVGSGGVFGYGQKVRLIPFAAVTSIRDGSVVVDETADHVDRSPEYSDSAFDDIVGYYQNSLMSMQAKNAELAYYFPLR